jgi:hypothetical protein
MISSGSVVTSSLTHHVPRIIAFMLNQSCATLLYFNYMALRMLLPPAATAETTIEADNALQPAYTVA